MNAQTAGGVSVKDIPSNVVAVGNPCRVMREVSERDKEYYYKERKIINENLRYITANF